MLITHRKEFVPVNPPVIPMTQAKHFLWRVFLLGGLLELLVHALQFWVSVPLLTPSAPWDFKPCAKPCSPAGTAMQTNNLLQFYDFPQFSQRDISNQPLTRAVQHSIICLRWWLESSAACSWALHIP